ncbi:AbrB/MazE/SpoVT family DNA-binding domain-containing protein [Chloroflexota bacterium]
MEKVERSHVREVELMPILVERILFRISEGSLAVTLPKAWVVYNHLKPGDTVEVIVNDGVTVHIKKKPGTEDTAES